MTTIREAMVEAAYRELDDLCAKQERTVRAAMRAAGCRKSEIDAHIADCRARVAQERERIPGNTVIALMRAGIPMETDANVWH